MTKSKRERKIAELKEKIREATLKWDYVRATKYKKELAALEEPERVRLGNCIKDRTPEQRREVTTRIIYAIAIGDILCSAIGDVEYYLRSELSLDGTNITDELKKAVAILQRVVKTIDDTGYDFFSENYMNIVDEIETMYSATLKNATLNKLLKAAKGPSKKGI